MYFTIRNFVLFRKDRGSHGGGVAVYVNSSIPCKRLTQLEPQIDSRSEVMWLQIRPLRLPREVSSILLGIVYHPPSLTSEDNQRLYDHVQYVSDSYLNNHPDSLIWVTGDFNPNSTNISSNVFKRVCGVSFVASPKLLRFWPVTLESLTGVWQIVLNYT